MPAQPNRFRFSSRVSGRGRRPRRPAVGAVRFWNVTKTPRGEVRAAHRFCRPGGKNITTGGGLFRRRSHHSITAACCGARHRPRRPRPSRLASRRWWALPARFSRSRKKCRKATVNRASGIRFGFHGMFSPVFHFFRHFGQAGEPIFHETASRRPSTKRR